MSHLPVPSRGKFYDLNVPYDENQKHMDSMLSTLKELGYSVVAFSKYVPSGSSKKEGKKKKVHYLPEVPKIKEVKDMTLLTRVTIELKQTEDQITVKEVITNGLYDIIAVEPKTEKLFLQACVQSHIVDIISIDGSERLPYLFKTQLVRGAMARGIQFEINYGPMVRDPVTRRITTTSALRLIECCKSKNVILSSKALHPLELRGPYDVANLGMLFEMKENTVPHVVSHNCRCVVVHSFVRKTAKGAVFIQKLDDDEESLKRKADSTSETETKKSKVVAKT